MSGRIFLNRRHFVMGAFATASLPLSSMKLHAAERIDFDSLYKSFGVLGLEFSDQVKKAAGKEVVIKGFMAPPLKAEAQFFVLTEIPMSICPFCSSDSDWPDNIVVVYLEAKQTFVQFNAPIETRGILEYGSWTDPETGFISQLRLRNASFRTM